MTFDIIEDHKRFRSLADARAWIDCNKPSGEPVYINPPMVGAVGAVEPIEHWPTPPAT